MMTNKNDSTQPPLYHNNKWLYSTVEQIEVFEQCFGDKFKI